MLKLLILFFGLIFNACSIELIENNPVQLPASGQLTTHTCRANSLLPNSHGTGIITSNFNHETPNIKRLNAQLETMSLDSFLENPLKFTNVSLNDPLMQPYFADLQRMYPGIQKEPSLRLSHYLLLYSIYVASLENLQFKGHEEQKPLLLALLNQLPESIKKCLNQVIKNNSYTHHEGSEVSLKIDALMSNFSSDQISATPNIDASEAYVAPCPLTNFGNTCYVNALLQVFWNSKEIRDFFYNAPITKYYQAESLPYYIAQLFKDLQNTSTGIQNSTLQLLCNKIKAYCNFGNEQQDAHELFLALFNELQITNPIKGDPLYPSYFGKRVKPPYCQPYLLEPYFGLLLRTRTINSTSRGKTKSETFAFEPMLSLGIQSPAGRTTPLSLKDLLDSYFGKETLEQPAQSQITQTQQAFINLSIEEPLFIGLHIKRFNGLTKDLRNITLPETMDIKPYLWASNNRNMLYRLSAVIIHEGAELNSGHYYTYIKNVTGWHCCNDHTITRENIPNFSAVNINISNKTPYIVFYKKMSDAEIANLETAPPIEKINTPSSVATQSEIKSVSRVNNKAIGQIPLIMKQHEISFFSGSKIQIGQKYCISFQFVKYNLKEYAENNCKLLKEIKKEKIGSHARQIAELFLHDLVVAINKNDIEKLFLYEQLDQLYTIFFWIAQVAKDQEEKDFWIKTCHKVNTRINDWILRWGNNNIRANSNAPKVKTQNETSKQAIVLPTPVTLENAGTEIYRILEEIQKIKQPVLVPTEIDTVLNALKRIPPKFVPEAMEIILDTIAVLIKHLVPAEKERILRVISEIRKTAKNAYILQGGWGKLFDNANSKEEILAVADMLQEALDAAIAEQKNK